MTMYAISRTSEDRFPVMFRPECDRTYFDPRNGTDEGLLEMIVRLDKAGYDLVSTLLKVSK